MDKQSKQGASTGLLPSIRTVKGNTASAPKIIHPKILVSRVQPQSNTAPILEGSQTTGKDNNTALLAVTVTIQDFAEVMKRLSKSWIASKDGRIYMCIDGGATGKFAMIEGKPYFDGVQVSVLLEKTLEK